MGAQGHDRGDLIHANAEVSHLQEYRRRRLHDKHSPGLHVMKATLFRENDDRGRAGGIIADQKFVHGRSKSVMGAGGRRFRLPLFDIRSERGTL
jgi:hypothetical protein